MKTGGECPPQDKRTNECLVDFDCKGNKKCCSQDCSFKCVEPVFDISATSKLKDVAIYLHILIRLRLILYQLDKEYLS